MNGGEFKLLELEIKRKIYSEKLIFENTALTVNQGEFIGIKGESGIGKSTLLSIIGLLENFEGNYTINNELITPQNREKERIKNFAYVFQKPYLIPFLTVKENILMPSKNLKEEIPLEEVTLIAKEFNITDILDRMPVNLSSGESERVALARAVLSKRKIILADEPTGNLDPNNAKVVMDLFKKINESFKTTIVMVTHSNLYDDFFDNIFFIKDNKVKEANE